MPNKFNLDVLSGGQNKQKMLENTRTRIDSLNKLNEGNQMLANTLAINNKKIDNTGPNISFKKNTSKKSGSKSKRKTKSRKPQKL